MPVVRERIELSTEARFFFVRVRWTMIEEDRLAPVLDAITAIFRRRWSFDMRVLLKPGVLVLTPEDQSEREAFAAWRATANGHVFAFDGGSDKGGSLNDIGLRAEACREPINILFGEGDPMWQPISNLAHAPFVYRTRHYASIEGFWQGLKFEGETDRRRVAKLWGPMAKRASPPGPAKESFVFDGQIYASGGPGHRRLMAEACTEKFRQDFSAREALLATGERPLMHRVRRDSRTIPGALMADIWMRIREDLCRTERGDRPGTNGEETSDR